MRRIATWSLVGLLTVSGGCASSGEMVIDVHALSEQARASIGDWGQLSRVSVGTGVIVDVDDSDVRVGKVSSISDEGLTLTGATLIPRASISRIRRVQSLSRLRAGKGGAIGFGFAVLAVAATGGAFWQPLLGYPLLGAWIGSGSASGVTRQTVLYQRR